MKQIAATFLVVAAVAGPFSIPAAEVGVEKKAVPSPEQQQQADKLIREVYSSDFEAADNHERRVALARKLIHTAHETKAADEQFALLLAARELGVEASHAETIRRAVSELEKGFRIDALAMMAAALSKVRNAEIAPEFAGALADALLTTAEQAVDAERFDMAAQLANSAQHGAQYSKDLDRENASTILVDEITKLEAMYKLAAPLLENPKQIPADVDLCLSAGKYACFVRGNWETGLRWLAAGGDEVLKAIARQEVANPSEAADQVDLADKWWDLAKHAEGRIAAEIKSHAASWYAKSLDRIHGLTKTKVKNRLLEVQVTRSLSAATNGNRATTSENDLPTEGPVTVTLEPIGQFIAVSHLSQVTQLAFSRDGTMLASCLRAEVMVWDVVGMRLLHSLTGHSGGVDSAEFSLDGEKLFTTSTDNTLRVWDVKTGRQLSVLSRGKPVKRLSLSNSGDRLILTADGKVRIWTLTGDELWSVDGDWGVLSPDERILASANSRAGPIRLWEMKSRRELMQLHSGSSYRLAFSPDGSMLKATPFGRAKVKFWDLKNRRAEPIIEANYGRAFFSPGGLLLVIDTYRVKFLDARTQKEIASLERGRIGPVAELSPDGKMFACVTNTGVLGIYRVKKEPVSTVEK